MKKQPKLQKASPSYLNGIKPLSAVIGDFIHYWGFRRIHGEIWALVYLSKEPLSGTAILKKLKVSKALVSPALKELLKYKLIEKLKSPDPRENLYRANPDFMAVIKQVLQTRELPMMGKIQREYMKFSDKVAYDEQGDINFHNLQALGLLIAQAHMVVQQLVQMNDVEDVLKLFMNEMTEEA